ncbi:hypothetical protein OHA72_35330 [Dactylosporangium sp. NBC_01737]|uniref:hypothetical protein n=1 Tax=Dactylosporangium sp. NBC_01737 TaxID=2975959 RepID=UPI002E103E8D|nr:hypothetical protein OHA72_35330 [Dactylosporangium sp. NBC_01737]
MTQPDHGGRDIGRLLDALVPELAAPPDRLAAVGRRVRRRRLLTTRWPPPAWSSS